MARHKYNSSKPTVAGITPSYLLEGFKVYSLLGHKYELYVFLANIVLWVGTSLLFSLDLVDFVSFSLWNRTPIPCYPLQPWNSIRYYPSIVDISIEETPKVLYYNYNEDWADWDEISYSEWFLALQDRISRSEDNISL